MRTINKIFSFMLLLCLMICMNGCTKYYKGYQGEFPELYTVAVYSLPEIRGYSGTSPEPTYYDPSIKIVEEDEYGRILFAYNEIYMDEKIYLLIMQKTDDKFAYYYQDINYLIGNGKMFEYENDFDAAIDNGFSNSEMEELKELNDWGREFDETKFIKVEITRKKS